MIEVKKEGKTTTKTRVIVPMNQQYGRSGGNFGI
jgi:hypothetical protein